MWRHQIGKEKSILLEQQRQLITLILHTCQLSQNSSQYTLMSTHAIHSHSLWDCTKQKLAFVACFCLVDSIILSFYVVMNYSRVSYESYHIAAKWDSVEHKRREVDGQNESQMRFVYHRVLHKIKLHEMNTTSFTNLETYEKANH